MKINTQTASESFFKIGIDLGGTKTEVIALDPDDAVLFRKRMPTPSRDGYGPILHCIADLTDEARTAYPATQHAHHRHRHTRLN